MLEMKCCSGDVISHMNSGSTSENEGLALSNASAEVREVVKAKLH